jgi:hypothetical protein
MIAQTRVETIGRCLPPESGKFCTLFCSYTTTIRGSNGQTYRLPPAEYHLDGAFSRDVALEKAQRAARRTLKAFAAVVSEATGVSWIGLTTVQPARSALSI